MTITRTSEIKAAIHRICDRHQISQENLAYDRGISHATLKNWKKGRRRCPKTALIALEALANKPLKETLIYSRSPGRSVTALRLR